MRKLSIVMLLFSFAAFTAFAGGYQVKLQGQKQTGIGLIGTPFALGASSMFYNPGSLSFMENNMSFSAGVSGVMANAIYQADGSNYQASTVNPTGTPFYFYGAGKVTDKLSVGVGVFTPYGNTLKWDDDWRGRYLIQEISLAAIFIQPTVAYKINDKFGIGAGLDIVLGSVELTKALANPIDGQFNMDGKTTEFGYNVGVFYKPNEKINIGVDYRSQVNMKVEGGQTEFRDVPSSLSTYFPSSGNFNAELPLPANLDIGVSYQVSEKFMLALEMDYVFWGVYDSLNIDFEINNEKLADSKNPREYSNTMIWRLGGEYKISEKLIARAGAYYDPSPTSDKYFTPETVSLNTIAFSLGLSYMPNEKLSIDISYLQLEGMETDKNYEPDNFGGSYATRTFIPGIGVSYNF